MKTETEYDMAASNATGMITTGLCVGIGLALAGPVGLLFAPLGGLIARAGMAHDAKKKLDTMSSSNRKLESAWQESSPQDSGMKVRWDTLEGPFGLSDGRIDTYEKRRPPVSHQDDDDLDGCSPEVQDVLRSARSALDRVDDYLRERGEPPLSRSSSEPVFPRLPKIPEHLDPDIREELIAAIEEHKDQYKNDRTWHSPYGQELWRDGVCSAVGLAEIKQSLKNNGHRRWRNRTIF